MSDINKNRTYVYTDTCNLCGQTNKYEKIVRRLKQKGKNVFVKQTTLFFGWQSEANEIGLEMPFVFDYDTGNSATTSELDKLSEEELGDWLGQ